MEVGRQNYNFGGSLPAFLRHKIASALFSLDSL